MYILKMVARMTAVASLALLVIADWKPAAWILLVSSLVSAVMLGKELKNRRKGEQ